MLKHRIISDVQTVLKEEDDNLHLSGRGTARPHSPLRWSEWPKSEKDYLRSVCHFLKMIACLPFHSNGLENKERDS
jgi:hypothetical protein